MRTPEQKAKHAAAEKAKYAARVIAAGKVVGENGPFPKYTEEQRRELRRIKSAKWREANRERAREITRDSMKRASDVKAVALGRPLGKRGRMPKILTLEEKRSKQNARVKKYYAENIERARVAGAVAACNRRARIKGNGGTHTTADVRELHAKQNGQCAWCALMLGDKKPHVDHWMPLSKGGSNGKDNLRLMHAKCNLVKNAKIPSEARVVFAGKMTTQLLKVA